MARPEKMIGSNKNAQLNFGRAYLFYVQSRQGSFSFKVSVTAFKPINQETGMSVDLVTLDRICKKIFKNTVLKNRELAQFLKSQVEKLKFQLEKHNTEVVRVHFQEKRGFGISFEDSGVYLFRTEFSVDKKGNLVEVTSQFDQKNKLRRLRLVHEKNQLIENIIY